MTTFITVAVGKDYSLYLNAAQAKLPDRVVVTTPLPGDMCPNLRVQSRRVKTNFAAYLPSTTDAASPVVLLDADLVFSSAFDPGVFGTLFAAEAVDVLAHPYRGKWKTHKMPWPLRSMPFDPEQNWHNSGVVAFKNLATAQQFSAAWRAQYAAVPYSDRDEYSFGLALTATKLVVAPLANELNSFQQSGALIWHDSARKFKGN